MKNNIASFMAGLFVAVSGSLVAGSASVPYVFSSGQKAKASEVNANFKSLDDRVKSLESTTGGGNSTTPNDPHAISYSYVSANAGYEFTLGDSKYRLIRAPVKGPDGKLFFVTFPTKLNDYSSTGTKTNTPYIQASLSINHKDYSLSKENASIGSFPAYVYVNDSFSYSYGGENKDSPAAGYDYGYWEQKVEASQAVSGGAQIDLGDYQLYVSYYYTDMQMKKTGVANTVSDFTSISLIPVNDNATIIGYIDTLIDYVKIERVP